MYEQSLQNYSHNVCHAFYGFTCLTMPILLVIKMFSFQIKYKIYLYALCYNFDCNKLEFICIIYADPTAHFRLIVGRFYLWLYTHEALFTSNGRANTTIKYNIKYKE